VHNGVVFLYAVDMRQIHQITVVAAGEIMFRQFVFNFLHFACGLKDSGRRMIDQGMIIDLDIIDIADRHFTHAVFQTYRIIRRIIQTQDSLDCATEEFGKRKIVKRLQNIIESLYGIPLNSILGQIRDKDNDHGRIHLPDHPRGINPIHQGHIHIHQDDVIFRAVFISNLKSVAKMDSLYLKLFFSSISFQIAADLFKCMKFIFCNGNPDHFEIVNIICWIYGTFFILGEKNGKVNTNVFSAAEHEIYQLITKIQLHSERQTIQ